MQYLILARHAETEPSNKNDLARDLTPHGRKQAQGFIDFFSKEIKYQPDFILCSSATRAMNTAKPLTDAFKIKTEFTESLYYADPEKLQLLIATHCDVQSLMVLSHNPTISQLTNWLYLTSNNYKRGGAQIFLKPSQVAIFAVESLANLALQKNLMVLYESI